MSRHRNIRNANFEDDDGFDDDYYSEEEYEEAHTESTESDTEHRTLDEINTLTAMVLSSVGPSFTQSQAKDALIKADYSTEKAVDALLKSATQKMSAVKITSKPAATVGVPRKFNLNSLKQQTAVPAQKISLSSLRGASLSNVQQFKPKSVATAPVQVKTELMIVAKVSEWEPAAPSEFARNLKSTRRPEKDLDINLIDTSKFKFDTPSPDDRVESARKKAAKAEEKKEDKSQQQQQQQFVMPPVPKIVEVKAKDEKPSLNLVVVGHVDSGKSTLTGHLLYDLGQISQKIMDKYSRDAAKIGRASFSYAWVLDNSEEERNRGVTIDVGINSFETSKRRFTILDAPGHKDFVPHMITGASQADVCLLVVDGGIQEQTKEHSLLIRSLGIKQIIVVINKMDMFNWEQAKYEEIRAQVEAYLIQLGFKQSQLKYVACSGFTGENLVKKHALPWIQHCLVDLLDQTDVPTRDTDKPLRLVVHDVIKGSLLGESSGQSTIVGRIEQGRIQVNQTIVIMPLRVHTQVKSISTQGIDVKTAVCGDQVTVGLTADPDQLYVGSILCAGTECRIVKRFDAQIITMGRIPIIKGSQLIFHHQSINEPVVLTKLIALLDKTSNEVVKNNPRVVGTNQMAKVELQLDRTVCMEEFKDCKQLGRFLLRSKGETVAAGMVLKQLE